MTIIDFVHAGRRTRLNVSLVEEAQVAEDQVTLWFYSGRRRVFCRREFGAGEWRLFLAFWRATHWPGLQLLRDYTPPAGEAARGEP